MMLSTAVATANASHLRGQLMDRGMQHGGRLPRTPAERVACVVEWTVTFSSHANSRLYYVAGSGAA